jgi:co-chaperonin GroES (HSP10)
MSGDLGQISKFKFSNKVKKVVPLGESVLVTDMNFSERFTSGGIVLLGDDGKASGIRPRWCRVYAVGPEQTDVNVGDWILVSHGRWSRGVELEIDDETFTVRKVDPNDILIKSDQQPNDDTFSSAVQVEQKHR